MNVSTFARPLIRNIILIIIILSSIYSQDLPITKTQRINSHWGAGIEFAKNSELGILGQYNLNNNLSFIGKVRYCTHDKKVYFSPSVKYYFNLQVSGIIPYIDIRYGKLHYDLKWSRDNEAYRVYVPAGDYFYWVNAYGTESGSSLINTLALLVSGGSEYIYNNFGVNASLGISYYTKLPDDSDDPENKRTKFFFTIGVLYYFN